MKGKRYASLTEKICYGISGSAYAAEMAVVNSYLLLFYTDVMNLSAVKIGTMFLCCKVLDAITDLLISNIADSTQTKFGRYRPWLLMCLPLAVSFVLMLWYPDFLHTETQKYIYCYLLYIITIPIFETSYMCPLMVLSATMSPNDADRVDFVTARSVGESVGDLIAASIVMPVVLLFGTSYRDSAGWRVMALIIGICVVLFGLVGFAGTRERIIAPNVDESGKRITFKSKFKTLLGNKLFWKLFFMQFGFNIVIGAPMALFSYYCIYCLGHEEWISGLMIIGTVVQIIVTLLGPSINARFERRAIIYTACGLCAVSWVLSFVAKTYTQVMLYNIVRCIANGILIPAIWSSWPYVIDYTEWKYGKAIPGIIMAMSNCGNKVAFGLCTYMVTLALHLFGYRETALVQSVSTIYGIRLSVVICPLIGVCLIIIMCALMPELERKQMEQVAQFEATKESAFLN